MFNSVRAILWMKGRTFYHRLFTTKGIGSLVVSALMTISLLLLALLIGLVFGVFLFKGVVRNEMIVFQVSLDIALTFILGAALFFPIFFSAGYAGFDPRRYLMFPISHRNLYTILLLSSTGDPDHLFYYPTLLAVLIVGILFPAKAIISGTAVVLLFMAVIYVWSNLLNLFLQNLLKGRRTREIFTVVVAFGFISLCFLPNFVEDLSPRFSQSYLPWLALDFLKGSAEWIPSFIAADAITALHTGNFALAGEKVLLLSVFLFAGLFSGYRAFNNYYLDPGGRSKSKRSNSETGEKSAGRWSLMKLFEKFPLLPPDVAAIAGKDFTYLLRSSPGKLTFLFVPVITLFSVKMFSSEKLTSIAGMAPRELVFLGMVFYSALLATNFINNAFAWEGAGIKNYYLSPVALKRILLGKNMAVWIFSTILLVLMIVTFSIISVVPGPSLLLTALFLNSSILLIFTIVGNILSLYFPKKNDIASWKMSSPSSLAVFGGLASMMATAGVVASAIFIPALTGHPAWTPALLVLLLLILAFAYTILLKTAGRAMDHQMESLINTVGS